MRRHWIFVLSILLGCFLILHVLYASSNNNIGNNIQGNTREIFVSAVKSANNRTQTLNQANEDQSRVAGHRGKGVENITYLVYNRVPKTGGRTVGVIISNLAARNSFIIDHSQDYSNFAINDAGQMKLCKELSLMPRPLVFDRHMFYVDCERHGHEQPKYINTVREPLERMISWYYFSKFDHHIGEKNPELRNVTFDECVETGQCQASVTQSQFFCGIHDDCKSPGPAWYQRAKQNLQEKYILVGLTHELDAFFQAAEKLLPRFFNGAHEIYQRYNASLFQRTKTSRKYDISKATEIIMNKQLAQEIDFYNVAKQRFYNTLRALDIPHSHIKD